MNIVILSYRISGNDGVSLECDHWSKILTRMGHRVKFMAGELDQDGILIPELHFQWPHVMELHDKVVYGHGNYHQIEDKIFDIAGTIEGKLRKTLNGRKNTDMLIIANAFSLPMHFPLAVALKRVIEELEIPTIAKHYDFWWERKRYIKSHLFPFFERWFPPNLPTIRHVVINKEAQRQLKSRRGIDSVVSSDSFDFTNNRLLKFDSFTRSFRKDFGIAKDEVVFLHPSRIIPRKRVELSIKLIKKLNDPKAVLMIAGKAGDEGKIYEEKIKKLATESQIRCHFISDFVGSRRKVIAISNGEEPVRKKLYTLWDCYLNSDFVIYPTKIEGFGNNFVESVYFKKPVILTPYPVFKEDIAPLGFEVIRMEPGISKVTIKKIKDFMRDKNLVKSMTDKNFELGKQNFSYEVTGKLIKNLISSF